MIKAETRVGLAPEGVQNELGNKRKMPTPLRLLDALNSFREEGVVEASIEDLSERARKLGGAKHWWEDRISTANLYESIHYLVGSDLVLLRYHLDVQTHDRNGNPVRKLLFRLAPEKTSEEPQK